MEMYKSCCLLFGSGKICKVSKGAPAICGCAVKLFCKSNMPKSDVNLYACEKRATVMALSPFGLGIILYTLNNQIYI